MRNILLSLLLLCPLLAGADELNNILNGVYKPQLLSAEQQDSIMHAYATVADSKDAESSSEPRWRLEYENKQPLYRRSFYADWYVVDTKKGTRTQIGGCPVRDAQLSPNNRYVVYSKENNLYIYKLDYMTEVPITTNNGERTLIGGNGQYKELFVYNGISDWLYEEEFGVTALYSFSPDSKHIAFVRLSDTDVPSFTWQDILDGNYPKVESLRYPKAGERNPKATICIYDIYYKQIHTIDIKADDCYLPRLAWTKKNDDPKHPVESKLLVQKINRDQNQMEVYSVNPKSTAVWPLYKEQSQEYYIDYSLFDQWQWLEDGRFVALSEREGWASTYLHDAQGQVIKRLTPDGIDVTRIYGVDEKTDVMYYQAAPEPMVRQCYACDLKKGTITPLTTEDGIHNFRFSADCQWAIEEFESYNTPNRYTLYEIKKGQFRQIEEVLSNDSLATLWAESGLPDKEFLTISTRQGHTLNAWMILPPDVKNGDVEALNTKHPCVLMQYSGAGSQQVLNRWRRGFGHYLASLGYVVINSDGRGTNARGRSWRNETYMNLGQKEADDQIATAQFAASLAFVDPERIAIMGWSYGGFQTIRTLCEKDCPISCGVAIAPVTDWRLYDTGYTERFMRRPQVNEKGYDQADLTKMADKMNGKLLIIHGLADDNVHAQHTWKLVDALVQAGKQFEMQIYPDDNHFLRKRANYEHVHRRVVQFLEKNL